MFCKKAFLLLTSFLITFNIIAQTIGVTHTSEESLQGYTFFSPFSGTKAYLVDNCGYLINEWDRGTRPGLSAYFLDNGLMLRTFKPSLVGPFTSASNAGGLELVDWNNNTVWAHEFNTATWLSHHDAVYMPNGNILVLTWELVFTDELIDLGRDPNEIANEGYMWSERIIEIETIGSDDMNIVWEWQIRDHYIQNFDPSKLNFGVVSEHPELFNINLPELNSNNSNSTRDWNHFNAIDYNQDLDQILISVRNSDEIWILDHSTTTAEAASHEGGLYGKGGDILYRWGNASAYERASVGDQKLFGQHGINWIKDGLEDAGKILIYNNGNGQPGPDFSTVNLLVPPQDANGGYLLIGDEPFGPEDPEWTYGDQPAENFYSPFLSNAQRLVNGNTLVNAGSPGHVFEIDPDKNIVWEYIIPLSGDFPFTQGQNPNNNATFRAYKFGPDFPGLQGVDLTQGSTIELGNSPVDCEIIVDVIERNDLANINVIYDPVDKSILVENPNRLDLRVSLVDISGKTLFLKSTNLDLELFHIPAIPVGIYFVQLLNNGALKVDKIFIGR